MGQQSDRNKEYMMDMWGTNSLVTDYKSPENQPKKMISEIMNDDYAVKKHNLTIQNELHQKIRNDADYDDWEYGTEPVYGTKS
jgi:lipoate synthase